MVHINILIITGTNSRCSTCNFSTYIYIKNKKQNTHVNIILLLKTNIKKNKLIYINEPPKSMKATNFQVLQLFCYKNLQQVRNEKQCYNTIEEIVMCS